MSGHGAVGDWLSGAAASLGHVTAVASSADEAMRVAQVVHADVVIVDAMALEETSCGEVVAALDSAVSRGMLPAVCVFGPQASAAGCSFHHRQASRCVWPVQIDALASAISPSVAKQASGGDGATRPDASC